jgi:hypothetical protein
MDDKLKQAFEIANYMTTLADQKRILVEEYNQNIIYFINGGRFSVNRELINFVKTLLDLGKNNAVVIDHNNLPVDIQDLKTFLDEILNTYFTAVNSYHNKYQKLRSCRSVESILNL